MNTDPAPSVGRLQETFASHPFSAHGSQWDLLWRESYTPWDRGGPSVALADVLSDHPEYFPSRSPPLAGKGEKKPRALAPGCGRGYDVLLLSAFGYDVTGLDVSAASVQEAEENERAQALAKDEMYAPRRGEKGTVKWVVGDFFAGGKDAVVEEGGFDLIYDYTFFCALPPEARHRWAKRMSELLRPETGLLVCLEWPLTKAPSTGGPPWGLTPETYVAHLNHPGTELEYTVSGVPVPALPELPSPTRALRRLAHIKPSRTHKSGYDEAGNVTDFISVWGHASRPL